MEPVKWRTVFAAFAAVLLTTFLISCDSPMGSFILPPDSSSNNTKIDEPEINQDDTQPDVDEIPPGYGGVIVIIGNPNAPRTILPTAPATAYKYLEFKEIPGNTPVENGWITPTGTSSVFLLPSDKDYVVEVIACNDRDLATSIAYGTSNQFTVTEGKIENVSVQLEWYAPLPATQGEGTFSYDVSLLETDIWLPTLKIAEMWIRERESGYTYRGADLNFKYPRGSNQVPDKTIGSIKLMPGHYDMILTFEAQNGNRAYKRDIIHIYRNLVSSYTLTNLSYDNFTTFQNGDIMVAAANPLAPEQMLVITAVVTSGIPSNVLYWDGSINFNYQNPVESVILTAEILGGGDTANFEWYIDTIQPAIYTTDSITLSSDDVFFTDHRSNYEITVMSARNSATFKVYYYRPY